MLMVFIQLRKEKAYMEVQGLELENNDGNLEVSPIPFSLNLQVPVILLLKDKIS